MAARAYKFVMGSERAQVLEQRLQPGCKTEMHGHRAIAMQAGKFRFITSDGETMEVDVPVGMPLYFEAVEHPQRTSAMLRAASSSWS